MDNIPQVEFPLNFSQCPNCGSTRRVTDEVLQAEQSEGKLQEVKSTHLFQQVGVVAPPSGRFLTAKAIVWMMDACADCGTIYIIHAEVQTVMQGTTPLQQQRPPDGLFGG